MDFLLIFQVVASAAASACSAASLLLWLLSLEGLKRRVFDKKLLIIGQTVIGGVIIIGSIVPYILMIKQVNNKSGSFWIILRIETGCLILLLILNEYLSIAALQSRLTHIVAIFFFFGALLTLLLSTYSQGHRVILLWSFMILNLAGLSFVYVQFIRFWIICAKPLHMRTNTLQLIGRYPSHTTPKHQQALWVASIGSIGLFLFFLGLTILACAKPCLWTQLTAFQVAMISLRRVAVSAYLLRAPGCSTVAAEV